MSRNKPGLALGKQEIDRKRFEYIQKGNNTNPTGLMLFKKGAYQDIDHRHYFRDEVFNGLDWYVEDGTPRIERTTCDF